MESVPNTQRKGRAEQASASVGWKRFLLTHVWLAPIVLLALWLRTSGLGTEHLYGDEAEYSIVARYLSRDPTYLAYPDITALGATPFVSQPPLILYIMALSVKIFGATDFAALLPSVLFGAATSIAVYALGYRLGGRFMGLGAAALIAVLPFHVEMSRRAMLDAGYVFFLVLTAYFCVAWLQDRSRRSAIGVGCATAAACLSKLPGILSGPVVALVFLIGLAITLVRVRQKTAAPGEVKETMIQGGLGALPVAIGAMLYLGLLWYLEAFNNLWLKLTWQFGRVDTDFAEIQEITAVHRDASFYFADPKFGFGALLGGIVFALAIVGLISIAVRFMVPSTRRPEHLVVPLFAGLMLGFFLYSDRKEGFYLLPFAPLAAVLIAYAGDGLRRMLAWAGMRYAPSVGRHVALSALVLGIVLVAVPAYGAVSESVEDYAHGDTQERYFGYGTREAAQYVHELDPDASQYGTLLGRFSLHWYNEQPSYHWYIDHTYVESQIKAGELKYIVYEDYLQLAFDREYMKELINKYNGQAIKTFRAGWGEVTVFELHP